MCNENRCIANKTCTCVQERENKQTKKIEQCDEDYGLWDREYDYVKCENMNTSQVNNMLTEKE